MWQRLAYHGWQHAYCLSHGSLETIAVADIGPRVLRFGFNGEANEFHIFPETLGQSGGDGWLPYGGHRLWHAPEDIERTYQPDNLPVQVQIEGDRLRLIQNVEAATGIQKELELAPVPGMDGMLVVHRLSNHNPWPVRLAAWALSIMAPGGTAVLPLPPRLPHNGNLLPLNTLTLWSYTDLSDPRYTLGRKYLLLRQDSIPEEPQKIGLMNHLGWMAYARLDHLLVKSFQTYPEQAYPDFGSTVEVFSNSKMLEMETLGPLVELPPGKSLEHSERWFLFRNVRVPSNDAEVEATILPHVRRVQRIWE